MYNRIVKSRLDKRKRLSKFSTWKQITVKWDKNEIKSKNKQTQKYYDLSENYNKKQKGLNDSKLGSK